MPRGGARANSGPAPDPNAIRRDRKSDAGTWTDLPAAGREGDAPKWPLAKGKARERRVWAELWATPQAVAWERLGWYHEVALYVRLLVIAESGEDGGVDVKAATEARQWSDRLGLNPASMLRNRWRVVTDTADTTEAAAPTEPTRPRARDRFRVVDGSGGA